MGTRIDARMDCEYCGKENTEQKCVIFGAPDFKDPAFGFTIGGKKEWGIKAGTMCCAECWKKAETKAKEAA